MSDKIESDAILTLTQYLGERICYDFNIVPFAMRCPDCDVQIDTETWLPYDEEIPHTEGCKWFAAVTALETIAASIRQAPQGYVDSGGRSVTR